MESPQIKRSLFILNPSAGIQPVKFILSKELQRRKHALSYFKSLSIDESGSHIRQSFDRFDLFIAAGGDGTVRSVASQLVGTDKVLGVLPMGSGNGFAREFGFRPNIPQLLKEIRRNEKVCIDIININDQICLNVAGTGLDSFVAHSFDKLKTRGLWSYIIVTIRNFTHLKPVRIKLTLKDETIDEELFVMSIANTRQFGNNAYIAPHARPDDGIIDIALIKPFPKILAPLFIYRLFAGKLHLSKYVRYIKTGDPFIISTTETKFHIDGEPVTFTGDIKVSIRRDALNVLRTSHSRIQ